MVLPEIRVRHSGGRRTSTQPVLLARKSESERIDYAWLALHVFSQFGAMVGIMSQIFGLVHDTSTILFRANGHSRP
jgi:hypothetical protein